MSSNYVKNIAIVGATGNSGSHMVASLLATGKHSITAITRASSASSASSTNSTNSTPHTFPAGVAVRAVDYASPASLTAALTDQDVLIITLGVSAPADTQTRLVAAAAAAGVRYILPNDWAPDSSGADAVSASLAADVGLFGAKRAVNAGIAATGASRYIAVATGFWYEWSLSFGAAFGIDLLARRATLFGDGAQRINVSTFPQVGRAVAALLSLPVLPAEGKTAEQDRACLEHYANGHVRVASFALSQREMLESAARVTGTDVERDWTVESEGVVERYERGKREMEAGDREGFLRMMYSRVFYPDGCGLFEERKGLENEVLGLPVEELDEMTAEALKRAEDTRDHGRPSGYVQYKK